MDENNIIDLTEEIQKKQPWYKRAWNRIKEIGEVVIDFCNDHFGIIFGALVAIAVGIWSWIFGWITGRQEGYEIGKRDGVHEGFREGYIDCTQDLKESGYKVYGGYGEDAGKLIVNKIVETHEEEVK